MLKSQHKRAIEPTTFRIPDEFATSYTLFVWHANSPGLIPRGNQNFSFVFKTAIQPMLYGRLRAYVS